MIRIEPVDSGQKVQITGPEGFGKWYLRLPETMMLDGPSYDVSIVGCELGSDGSLTVSGRCPSQDCDAVYRTSFEILYRPCGERIDIAVTVTNSGTAKWTSGGEVMACLQPTESNEEFADRDGSHTHVLYEGDFRRISQFPDLEGEEFVPGAMFSYRVQGEEMHPDRAQNHQHMQVLDSGVIMRTSHDGTRIVAFYWDRVHRVSGNGAISCIHSNPRITDLPPDQTETRRGSIYFVSPWRRIKRDFALQ